MAIVSSGILMAQKDASISLSFNHMAFSVTDIDRSASFYRDVVKLTEITNRTKNASIRWFSLGEGKELHLISGQEGKVIINKAVHLGLACSNFDAFVKMLDASNIQYSDWPGTIHKINVRADGIKQIYFQDPDGYWIEINNASQ